MSLLTATLMLLLRAALPAATLLVLPFPVLSFANHAFAILVPVLALAVRAVARLVRRHTLLPALLVALILVALLLLTALPVVPTRLPLRLIAFVRHSGSPSVITRLMHCCCSACTTHRGNFLRRSRTCE
jgi:hypothetical protein